MEQDWISLTIDEWHMWASVMLNAPEGDEQPTYSVEQIEEFLSQHGITMGIDKPAIEALVASGQYGVEVIVAKGKDPVDGVDGYYEFVVPLEDAKDKPRLNPDGSVDYYNSLKLAMVKKDDLVAKYYPPTNGEFGYTVEARILQSMRGKEPRQIRGKGLYICENGKEYRASYDGRIYKSDDNIIVDKIYVVNGDLDIAQGNIFFSGDVEVKGDVRSGLKIVADGNVFIHGHVGSCQIQSGGNITIRKGVQGKNKCQIIAKGDVAASFVERCTIAAEGNVYADSLMDAYIAAKQKVVISSKVGCIVGGDVYGMLGIEAKHAGNDTNIHTKLSTGLRPEDVRQVNELKQKLKKLEKDVELLDKNMKMCESSEDQNKAAETETMRMRIVRAKVTLSSEERKLREQIEQLESSIDAARNAATIHISKVVYPGVSVYIGDGVLAVKDACKDVVFRSLNHAVIMEGAEH